MPSMQRSTAPCPQGRLSGLKVHRSPLTTAPSASQRPTLPSSRCGLTILALAQPSGRKGFRGSTPAGAVPSRALQAQSPAPPAAAATATAEVSVPGAKHGGGVRQLTAATFQGFVDANADGSLMVVDWYTPLCGPCKLMAPKLQTLSEQFEDVSFAKFDCHCDEQHEAFAAKLRIRALPTFHLYRRNDAGELLLLAEVTGARERELRRAIAVHRRNKSAATRYWG